MIRMSTSIIAYKDEKSGLSQSLALKVIDIVAHGAARNFDNATASGQKLFNRFNRCHWIQSVGDCGSESSAAGWRSSHELVGATTGALPSGRGWLYPPRRTGWSFCHSAPRGRWREDTAETASPSRAAFASATPNRVGGDIGRKGIPLETVELQQFLGHESFSGVRSALGR
jgi:hypothetical protein